MTEDQQDILNFNRNESEQLLGETKSKIEQISKMTKRCVDESKNARSSTDDTIQHSLQLLSKRSVPVKLPKEQKQANAPEQLSDTYEKRSWTELVNDADVKGFKNTNIEGLLTPLELAEADDEYIKVKKAFSKITRLDKADIALLLLTVALQCARQYIFANDKFRFSTTENADDAIKAPLKKITSNE